MEKRDLKLTRTNARHADMIMVDKAVARVLDITCAKPPASPTTYCSDRYLHNGRLYKRHHNGKKEVWQKREWSPSRRTTDALDIMTERTALILRSVGADMWMAELAGTLELEVQANASHALIALTLRMQGASEEEWAALGRLWPEKPTDC